MKTNKTETVIINGNEVVVNDLAVSMNVSSIIQEDGTIMVNANVRLQPFALIDGKRIKTDLQDRVILTADIANSQDTDVLTCFGKINAAIEEYVIAKNI